MAKRLMGVALIAGWLGLSAAARAQFPAPPGAGGPGYPPAEAGLPGSGPGFGAPPGSGDGPPHGYPGNDFGPPPPPLNAPVIDNSLPANGFSNIHPEQVSRSPRFYLGADYVFWWIRKDQIPALVTQGSINDLVSGAAGQAGTIPVIGPGAAGVADQAGLRLTATYWFDQDHTWAAEASGFALLNSHATMTAGGTGSSDLLLARPFFNPNTATQDADPLVVPQVQGGGISVTLQRRFWGAEANVRCSECTDFLSFSRVSAIAGVRYLYLDEKLMIEEGVNDLPDSQGNPGNSALLHDNFTTYNRFYGGQLGFETESRVGQLTLTLLGKLAAGRTTQVIRVYGDTLINEPGFGTTYDPTRGFLTQPTNIGRYSKDRFDIVPELGVTLAWEFNEHFKMSVGYDLLYWSSVVRPGDQIDTIVNVGAVNDPGQLGSSIHPYMPFHATGFWAQGINAGLQVSY